MTNLNFERCADFLARMIEKYGGELDLSEAEEHYRDRTTDETFPAQNSAALNSDDHRMTVLTDLQVAC